MEGSSPHGSASAEPRRKKRRQSSMSADSQRELGHMRAGRDTGTASFVGSGSGIYFVRIVRTALARNSSKRSAVDSGIDEELIPGEDDRLHIQDPSSSIWRADEVLLENEDHPGIPCSFDDLVRWTNSYFDSWHPPFPFLHAPTILGVLEKLSMDGLSGINYTDNVIVRSIMSISLADRRQMPNEGGNLVPSHLVFQTSDDAISALQPLIVQPSSLPGLQAVVSVQIFLISMLRLNAASRLGGLIVRMAFYLGLHRCPSRFRQFSAADVEIRRRLFWSIYYIERYLSQALGLPLDLKDDDLDVCYSGNELHRPLASESTHISGTRSLYDPRRLLLPTFLAKHGRIKGLILELRNKSVLHSHTDPDEVAYIDAEISKWWNEVQDLLDPSSLDDDNALGGQSLHAENPSTSPKQNPLKSSHRLLLIVQKHESVILLNRPVITSGYNTSAFAAAMQKCIGASKAIVSNVYRHLNDGMKIQGVQDGRIQNPLFWTGFIWAVWQSGLILLYAASEGHYSVQAAQREATRCVAILENLSLRGNFWPGACAAAVKELQSALSNKFSSEFAILDREAGSTTNFHSPQANAVAPLVSSYNSQRIDGGFAGRNVDTDTMPAAERAPSGSEVVDDETRSYTSSSRLHQDTRQVTRGSITPYGQSYEPNATSPHVTSRSSLGHYNFQGMPGTSQMGFPTQPTVRQGSLSGNNIANTSDAWPDFNPALSRPGDRLDGFDDIFQLLDVSYLLSEQIAGPQSEVIGNFSYPQI